MSSLLKFASHLEDNCKIQLFIRGIDHPIDILALILFDIKFSLIPYEAFTGEFYIEFENSKKCQLLFHNHEYFVKRINDKFNIDIVNFRDGLKDLFIPFIKKNFDKIKEDNMLSRYKYFFYRDNLQNFEDSVLPKVVFTTNEGLYYKEFNLKR